MVQNTYLIDSMNGRYKTIDILDEDFREILAINKKSMKIICETISPAYVIIGPGGYFERIDSWGNARWNQDKRKAFSGLFGDCQNEVMIRGLKDVEIRMK